ncbi:hypothetical protein [Nocardia sp. X0981]
MSEAIPPLPVRTSGSHAMAAAPQLWHHEPHDRGLYERVLAGLHQLDEATEPQEPVPADTYRMQDEIDRIIARWKARNPETVRYAADTETTSTVARSTEKDCRATTPFTGYSHAHLVMSTHVEHRCRRYYDALHYTTEPHRR